MKFDGCPVILRMENMLLEGFEVEDRVHYCKVIEYDSVKEQFLFLLRGEEVDVISLDAIYNCKVMDGESYVKCKGNVVERYLNSQGNMLIFQVKNGFYKNSLN